MVCYNCAMNHEEMANRKLYKLWTPVNLRYGDTDALGHINNAVYVQLLESGRCELLFPAATDSIAGAGRTFVIVNIIVNFKAEMHFPGVAQVGTAVQSFGRSSVKIFQAVYKDAQDPTCYCTSESTIVLIDQATRKAIPIDDALRKMIEDMAGVAYQKA